MDRHRCFALLFLLVFISSSKASDLCCGELQEANLSDTVIVCDSENPCLDTLKYNLTLIQDKDNMALIVNGSTEYDGNAFELVRLSDDSGYVKVDTRVLKEDTSTCIGLYVGISCSKLFLISINYIKDGGNTEDHIVSSSIPWPLISTANMYSSVGFISSAPSSKTEVTSANMSSTSSYVYSRSSITITSPTPTIEQGNKMDPTIVIIAIIGFALLMAVLCLIVTVCCLCCCLQKKTTATETMCVIVDGSNSIHNNSSERISENEIAELIVRSGCQDPHNCCCGRSS